VSPSDAAQLLAAALVAPAAPPASLLRALALQAEAVTLRPLVAATPSFLVAVQREVERPPILQFASPTWSAVALLGPQRPMET
jgi:hypothetical protein